MANKIKLKRGLSTNVSNLQLETGELAVTTDTGELYVGDKDKNVLKINEDTTYTLSKSGSTITLTGSDGSTQSVSDSNTTYSAATQSANGLMSSTDKTKLDGIATGANNYSLPTASSSTLGGVKVGTNLSISNGVLSATDTKYNAATTSAAGLMSANDKTKLNGIATGATANTASSTSPKAAGTAAVGSETNYARGDHVHPAQTTVSGNAGTATKFASAQSVALTGDVTGSASSQAGWSVATTLANSGVTAGSYGPTANVTGSDGATINVPQITVDAKGRVTSVTNRTYTSKDSNTTYSAATTSANGLMSSSDKTKLNGIATGAQVNNVIVSTSQPSSGEAWINPNGQTTITALQNRIAVLEDDTGWRNLTLASGVSAVRARIRRKCGIVFLEIINLTGWTTQTTFTTIPEGFRPDTASVNNTYRWAAPTTGANWTRPEFKADGGLCIFTTTTTAGAWTDIIVSYIPVGY